MKYIVSIAVDGCINIEVDTDNTDEARDKALDAFATADLSKMMIVGRNAIDCQDEDGNILTDYD